MATFGNPAAQMGFIGFARYEFPNESIVIRARSADVKLTQGIEKPEVIDGRFDKSVYTLQPQMVEGSVEYPAIMERTGRSDPSARLYRAAIGRELSGTMVGRLKSANLFNLGVRYSSASSEFRYKECIINTWKFSCEAGAGVNINTGLIGRTRENADIAPLRTTDSFFPKNTRQVTWNDVVLEIQGRRGAPNIDGAYMRSFEVNINNNAERYYTFNGLLFPQDITARKRDLSGSMKLLGRHEALGEHARTNQDRCYEESRIRFGYDLNRDECNSVFVVTWPNIVFQIEEVALTTDIFETTVNFHCLPDAIDMESSEFLETGGAVTI